MPDSGWRNIIISSKSSIFLEDSQLIIKKDSTHNSIPLSQIKTIMINNNCVNIQSNVISALSENKIRIVFCNSKHNPVCELHNYSGHSFTAGRLSEQIYWQSEHKDKIWNEILKQKFDSEHHILMAYFPERAEKFLEIANTLMLDNTDIIEAKTAKFYFQSLFGATFRRRSCSPVNEALNYGYTILYSEINRCIAFHGYNAAIGIHHHGCNNSINLTCDFIEPFRCFVDEIVINNKNRELDWEYKKVLMSVTEKKCIYNEKKTTIANAIDMFSGDIFVSLKKGTSIGKVGFCA